MSKLINRVTQGFSSIEALIATAILAVSLIAIIGLFPFILRLNKQAEYYSLASALARAKIEQLIVTPYDQLTVGNIEPRAHVVMDSNDPLYIFERQSSITLVNGNLQASQSDIGLKKIETTVYWPNKQGSSNSLIISSLIASK